MTPPAHERLHELFTRARGLDAGARTAFLRDACDGDGALHAELRAMIAADAEAGDVFAGVASGGGGAHLLARELAMSGELEPRAVEHPERIGHYRIVRVIGEGGMGVVYEAEQDDPKRRVALKVVRPTMITRGLLQRFRHEAQVLGQLRHPGIAQIFEAGAADDGEGGQPYFAMELIEGAPLLEYADAHDLGLLTRLEIIAALCDALHHAHQKGVIHRDLKPANILVTNEGAGAGAASSSPPRPQPKILDFGVARATDADVQAVTVQTSLGELIGTVPYMSPEQAEGDPAAIDVRSDVYTVGVVAYELLTGRLPYEVRGKLVHESVRVIREDEPSRMSSINRSLRGDVETMIAKALEKDMERRYQSAAELAADVRRYLAHEPIAARPASALYQARKFARRHKGLVGGAAVALAVAIAGAGVAARFAVVSNHRADALERATYVAGLAAAVGALEDGDLAGAAAYLDRLPDGHRGWEYDHLRARLEQRIDTWETPTPVAAAWNASAPVFDPAGERMFAPLVDRSIGVWEVATGRFVRAIRFESREEDWWRVCIHGGSMRFAATRPDGTIAVHDLETGAVVETVPAARPARTLAWDTEGGRFLYTGAAGLGLWDGRATRRLASFGVRDAVFDHSGERIAAVVEGGTITIFDADTGSVLVRSEQLQDELMLAFSPDGEMLAAPGLYGNDFLLDARTLEVVTRLRGHRLTVMGFAWDDAGTRLLTISQEGTMQIWDRATRRVTALAAYDETANATLGLMPDGRAAVVAGPEIALFPVRDPSVLRGHESFVYRVRFSPDGRWLASAGLTDDTIGLWDVATGRSPRRLPAPHAQRIYAAAPVLAFSPDSRRLVAAAPTDVKHWDLETFEDLPAAPHDAMDGWVAATLGAAPRYYDETIATSPDGRVLAHAVPGSSAVELYEVSVCTPADASGHRRPLEGAVPFARLEGHAGVVYCVDFSPDGTRLATGGADTTVRIWDVRTYEQLLVLRGHDDYVKDVEFSPDGTLLASGSGDMTVRLWDTMTPAERRALADERRH